MFRTGLIQASGLIKAMGYRQFSAAAQSPLATLRKQTGYAYAMCKKALEVNNGDMATAKKWLEAEALRSGLQKAEKMSGRAARQGLIGLICSSDKALIVEVNCETDFVSKNEQFQQLVNNITESIFVAKNHHGKTISGGGGAIQKTLLDLTAMKSAHEELIGRGINSLGEKIQLSRALLASIDRSKGHLFGYTHSVGIGGTDSPCLLGKTGAIVAITPEDDGDYGRLQAIGKALCQHVIGLNPTELGNREDENPKMPPAVPPPVDPIAAENEPVELTQNPTDPQPEKPQSKKTKKPPAVEEQIDSDAELDEHELEIPESDVLYDQALIFDSSHTVRDLAQRNKFHVLDFIRIECGEQLTQS